MKKLVLQGGACFLTAGLICGILSSMILGSDAMVEIGNKIALLQMQDSQESYYLLQLYNQVRHMVFALEAVAWGMAIIFVIKDVYQYIKTNRKGEN